MIVAAFDHPTADIQVAVLKKLPVVVNLIEYDALKNTLLPKIQVLYCRLILFLDIVK